MKTASLYKTRAPFLTLTCVLALALPSYIAVGDGAGATPSVPGWDSTKPSFRYIAVADTHRMQASRSKLSIPFYQTFLENIKGLDADFLVILGDICGEDRPALAEIAEVTKQSGYPVYFVSGNHDDNDGKKPEEFQAAFGDMRYTFSHKGWFFVVQWSQRPDNNWLDEVLSNRPAGESAIFFQHYPPKPREIEVLWKHKVALSMHGHVHNFRTGMSRDLRNITLDMFVRGFAVVDVFPDKRIRSNWREHNIRQKFEVVHPGDGATLAPGRQHAVVTAFDSYRDVVKVEYDAGEGWQPMVQETDRSWGADIDVKGAGRLQVRATDNSGEVWTAVSDWAAADTKPVIKIGSNWSVWGGTPDNRRSSADDTAPPLELAWRTALGGRCHQPVLHNGKLYVATSNQDFEDRNGIAALDPTTGTVLWRAPLLGAPLGSVAASGEAVGIVDRFDRAYAFDAQTGRELWQKSDIRGTFSTRGAAGMNTAPNASDGVLYAGNLHALSLTDGEELWKGNIAQYQNRPPAIGYGFIYGAGTGTQYLRDLKDGNQIHVSKSSTYRASVMLPDAVLRNGNQLLSTTDGSVQRTVPVPPSPLQSDIAFSSDGTKIFYGAPVKGSSEQKALHAIDFNEGTKLWLAPAGAKDVTAPTAAKNFVWFTTGDGQLHAVDINTGKAVWSKSFGIRMDSPIVSGNAVFIAGEDGCVYGFAGK